MKTVKLILKFVIAFKKISLFQHCAHEAAIVELAIRRTLLKLDLSLYAMLSNG